MSELSIRLAEGFLRYLAVASLLAVVAVGLGWLAVKLRGMRSPVYRHQVWLLCLAAVALVPALRLAVPKLPLKVVPDRVLARTALARQAVRLLAFTSRAGGSRRQQAQTTHAGAGDSTREKAAALAAGDLEAGPGGASLVEVAAALWAVGVAVMLLRLARAWARLKRLCSRATSLADCDALTASLGGGGRAILLSEELTSPICCGLLRARLVLPRTLYETATPQELRMVLKHELAHVRRGDCFVNLFQRLMEAFFFFHPLVWYASRQVSRQRERIFDNVVLSKGGKAMDYARLLSKVVERGCRGTLEAVALCEGGLAGRVAAILDPSASRHARLSRRAAAVVGLTAVLMLGLLGSLTLAADGEKHRRGEFLSEGATRPDGASTISGRIVSAKTGEPIADAHAWIFSFETHTSVHYGTSQDGKFIFKNIAAGRYGLHAGKRTGFQKAVYDPSSEGGQLPSITLAKGEKLRNILFKLEPAYSVSGRVLDESGNCPSQRERYLVYAWGKRRIGTTSKYRVVGHSLLLDEKGSFKIDGLDGRPVYVMVGNYKAPTDDNPYPPRYFPGTFSRGAATLLKFGESKEISGVDIALARTGGAVLTGSVKERDTGKPVANAFVIVHHEDMLFDRVSCCYTDEEGRFRIEGLSEGKLLAHVDAAPFGYVRTNRAFEIEKADGAAELDFTLAKGTVVRGRFVDLDGKLVSVAPRGSGRARVVAPGGRNNLGSGADATSKHYPLTFSGRPAYLTLTNGDGDYNITDMILPTEKTFAIYGLPPGKTRMTFVPRKKGWEYVGFRLDGRRYSVEETFETKAGQKIEDLEIIVKTK